MEDRHDDSVSLFVVNKETWLFLCVSSFFLVHISFFFACNLSLSLSCFFVCMSYFFSFLFLSMSTLLKLLSSFGCFT